MHMPMAPSCVIGKGTNTVTKWTENGDHYDITVKMDATADEIKAAETGTATSDGLMCPHCGNRTPISVLRRDRTDSDGKTVYSLRMREKHEFEPRPDDVFQERLYAIKYEHTYTLPVGKVKTKRYYRAPNERDLENEKRFMTSLRSTL
jgi:putative DNA methylase